MVVPGNEKFCHYGCWGPKVRKSYGAPSSQGHSKGALFLFWTRNEHECNMMLFWDVVDEIERKWHGVKSYVLEWLEIMMWCGISDFIWYVRLICINISTALSTLMLSWCILFFLKTVLLATCVQRCQHVSREFCWTSNGLWGHEDDANHTKEMNWQPSVKEEQEEPPYKYNKKSMESSKTREITHHFSNCFVRSRLRGASGTGNQEAPSPRCHPVGCP